MRLKVGMLRLVSFSRIELRVNPKGVSINFVAVIVLVQVQIVLSSFLLLGVALSTMVDHKVFISIVETLGTVVDTIDLDDLVVELVVEEHNPLNGLSTPVC